MTLDPLLLAGIALLVAVAALAVALLAWRRADDALSGTHSHPHPDRGTPMLVERREDDLGPPRATGERRGRHAGADERARRRDRDEPRWTTRDPDATGQLPATELPTTAMPAQGGPVRLPPPGAIRGG